MLGDLGPAGRAAQAQLRSQRGKSALSGLTAAPGVAPMHGMAVATVMLTALFVDAWGVQPRDGALCPNVLCKAHLNYSCGPTTAHAMSCHWQVDRGYNSTHLTQKRCLQKLLREHAVPWVTNEDASMFLRADRRADTAVARGSMHMARDAKLQHLGVVLDTTVRAPILATHLAPKRVNAANTDGYAAQKGEEEKRVHHKGCLDDSQWRLVPFAQETFGRLGIEASNFLRQLAAHAAACKGGTSIIIRRRAGIVLRRLVVRLSASLHAEQAERVFAYVRNARHKGWVVRPVSAHLHTITPSASKALGPAGPAAPPP